MKVDFKIDMVGLEPSQVGHLGWVWVKMRLGEIKVDEF